MLAKPYGASDYRRRVIDRGGEYSGAPVFRKDDYAVKYAVEPLLDGDGPLGDLSVRLKLIYGWAYSAAPNMKMRSC